MHTKTYNNMLLAACLCGLLAVSGQAEDAPAAKTAESSEVTFGSEVKHTMRIPASWKREEPSNKMRQFQARITKNEGDAEDAELSIFKFPAGGGVDANIKRWADMMGGAESLKLKRQIKTAAGADVTVAEMEGAYTARTFDGTSATPKKDFKMIGAIVVTDAGEIYIRMVGPKNTVESSKSAFDKMVESFK